MNYLPNEFKSKALRLLLNAGIVVTRKDTFDRLVKSERSLQHYKNFIAFSQAINISHVKRALDLLPFSRGEIFQDIFVMLCLERNDPGFFVEFGATDGLEGSNTWLMEKKFGWNGIVAEPGRVWKERLARNRSCIIESDCVWSETGKQLEFRQANDAGFSTLSTYADKDRHALHRSNCQTYFVETVSLHDMLLRSNSPKKIDYISIDTEGSEFDILSSFPFEQWDISILTVEHNFRADRENMQKLMQSHGFVRVLPDLSKFDDWYVSPELVSKVNSVFS